MSAFETALRERARRIAAIRLGLPLPPAIEGATAALTMADEVGQKLQLAPLTRDFAPLVIEETLALERELREGSTSFLTPRPPAPVEEAIAQPAEPGAVPGGAAAVKAGVASELAGGPAVSPPP